MASGDLFRAFTVRFSFKKEQHVRMLQKFEDRKLNDGKTKNQVVMDALEMYFDALEKQEKNEVSEELTSAYLEKRLSEMEERIRIKLLQEIAGIVLRNAVTKQPAVFLASSGKSELDEMTDGSKQADITEMPDIMDKVMSWSDN